MGKWNNRYYLPRNRQRRYEYEYPTYEDIDSSSSGVGDSRVPSWEIDYCKSVRIPWNKVVASKYLLGFYPTVQDWDDSASKESFENAKARYWEMTNGIPVHSSPLPDPDMFIDEIDWNPYIDPKQMEDLDLQFFNPDEEHKLGSSNKDSECEQKPNNGNAWERDKEQESGNVIIFGWGSSSGKLQSDNLWEQSNEHVQDSGDVTNGWGEKIGKHVQGFEDGWGEKRGKHVQDSGDVINGWGEKSGKNVRDYGDVNNGWGEKSGKHVQDSGDVNNGWGHSVKLENDNPWEQSGNQLGDSSNENAWKSVNESWGRSNGNESRGRSNGNESWRRSNGNESWGRSNGNESWSRSNGNESWGRSNGNESWGRDNGNESWGRSNGNAKRNFSNGRWQNNNGNRSRGWRDSEYQGNGSSFWSCKRYREDGESRNRESCIQHSTNYKSSRY